MKNTPLYTSGTPLYILSNGRVAAIDKQSGDIIWEIKLRQYVNGAHTNAVGQISYEENRLYISIPGILICLDAKDGALIWKNELKGWGYGFVSMANANADTGAASAYGQAATAAIIV